MQEASNGRQSPEADHVQSQVTNGTTNGSSIMRKSSFSPATTEILKRVSASQANGTDSDRHEAAREHILRNMVTSDSLSSLSTPPTLSDSKNDLSGAPTTATVDDQQSKDAVMSEQGDTIAVAMTPARGSARGRGRPRGRPSTAAGTTRGTTRGRGRGGRGSRGKRRRTDDEGIRVGDSPSTTPSSDAESVEYTPLSTTTKSGRSVQKPTSLSTPVATTSSTANPSHSVSTPTISSLPTGMKRKRAYHRQTKNPELTVCKVCLRPHSPASNMIVFCDSCNGAFHRYCHHPPIDQAVVDVPDLEWFCAECSLHQRLHGLDPETQVRAFENGKGASAEQIRAHLRGLSHATVVEVVVQATQDGLGVRCFAPGQKPKRLLGEFAASAPKEHPRLDGEMPPPQQRANGKSIAHSHAHPAKTRKQRDKEVANAPGHDLTSAYDEDDPPAHYPRPGFGLARMLRPENEDLGFLVDDNTEVYGHFYQSDAKEANKAFLSEKERKMAEDAEKNRKKAGGEENEEKDMEGSDAKKQSDDSEKKIPDPGKADQEDKQEGGETEDKIADQDDEGDDLIT